VRALARIVTRIETGGAAAEQLLGELHPHGGQARVIGLTGPPGVGKSTLTGCLTAVFRARGQRVGVIAVDPTSPFSGGALLGDRIRMVDHFEDDGVFIRSMATRGHLGGVAATTGDVIDVLDACRYDVVLVETIGVGQDAVEIARLVEVCLLVLTPALGDEIQTLKGGIMEIGDIYVINKADLGGADRVEAALRATLGLTDLEAIRPIVRTTATDAQGLDELVVAIDETEQRLGGDAVVARRLLQARQRVHHVVSERLQRLVRTEIGSEADWRESAARVAERAIDPYRAADELLDRAGLGTEVRR